MTEAPDTVRSYLTVPQIAERLGVDPTTVRKAIRGGLLVAHYPFKQPRIERADLEVYLHRQGYSPAKIARIAWDIPT